MDHYELQIAQLRPKECCSFVIRLMKPTRETWNTGTILLVLRWIFSGIHEKGLPARRSSIMGLTLLGEHYGARERQ